MTTYTEILSYDTQDERWRHWQMRGRIRDRRSAVRARLFAAVMFGGVLAWLTTQLLPRL